MEPTTITISAPLTSISHRLPSSSDLSAVDADENKLVIPLTS